MIMVWILVYLGGCSAVGMYLEKVSRRYKMSKNTTNFRRIAWLDSANMASHIHLTDDGGETTLCGHEPAKQSQWKVTSQVPRSIQGRDQHCSRCFKIAGVKKSVPFLDKEDSRVTAGECVNSWPYSGAGKGL